eukprot:scaffold42031_cov189-Skeletonema_dohrnii-CCMP3373.AAC.1
MGATICITNGMCPYVVYASKQQICPLMSVVSGRPEKSGDVSQASMIVFSRDTYLRRMWPILLPAEGCFPTEDPTLLKSGQCDLDWLLACKNQRSEAVRSEDGEMAE